MTISIAMATCNGAKYLAEQLHSISTQSILPDELIISDDASTDSTCDVVDQFRATAPFPVVLHQSPTNRGVTDNFSKALSLCSGDIIFLSDQDDYWFPDKLAQITGILHSDDTASVAVHDAILTDSSLRPTGQTRFSQAERAGQSSAQLVQGACTTIRSDLLNLLLPIPSDLYTHDHWIHAVGAFLGVRTIVATPLQYFRRHERNASSALVSQLEPISRITLWTRRLKGGTQALSSHPESLRLQLNKLLALRQWWQENRPSIEALCATHRLPPPNRAARAEIDTAVDVLQWRLTLMSKPKYRRLAPLVSAHTRLRPSFPGGREFLKDALS